MKKIKIILVLMCITLQTYAYCDETAYGGASVSIADLLAMKFNHTLSYYTASGKVRSPLLYEQNSTPGLFAVLGKNMPSVSYGRNYDMAVKSTSSQYVSVSFDLYRIASELEQRSKQVDKNKFTKEKLIKDISELFTDVITLEEIYVKMQGIYATKNKVLSNLEKLHDQGAIADYKLTDLRLEIQELDLKISETKNKLVKNLIELHFIAGIVIVE